MNSLAQKLDNVKIGKLHHFPYADCQDFLARNQANEPVFLFSPSQIGRTAQRFLEKFPGEVSYAVKANPAPEVPARSRRGPVALRARRRALC